ncbi:MBL fold metallo-hydrolase [Geobacter sp. SVR]|uniref:ribonuclease Z n=1 Tax=Geobacter sp. SVR TaxID=2495594 RepID=UPI00143F01C9|nr:MBL fold metallo-hydrolase [Geobacter sp. SVR]BCS56017.1 ribonuclease Z [Geobacter sp. SVR]GCF84780.1 ribonuclease Z [Geobacter sp. SVR]
MTPIFHPFLINPPFEDPGLFVDFLFSRRAILFDLGRLERLPARKLLRISHVFVSHTHIDHFIGFDHLVRLCLGRDIRLHLYGPPGFASQVGHRLAAYTWNLVSSYGTDFTLVVTEIASDGSGCTCEYHCLRRFQPEGIEDCRFDDGVVHSEENLLVRAAPLDHQITSLAYCLEEKRHVNIMKNRLEALGLAVGPWLKELKSAIQRGEPDETPIAALTAGGQERVTVIPLGEVREQAVRVAAGQKICYVTDAGFTPDNAARIVALARGADYLFIETPFLHRDVVRAAERHHLTARQAGELGRAAGVARMIPFHFSPRYMGQEHELRQELEQAWLGR